LEDRYDASVSERQELGRRKERTTNRVQRAASLISALSNEKVRPNSSYTIVNIVEFHKTRPIWHLWI
jgi:hypothetical protein